MTPSEAAKLLDLPLDATSEQLEARFLELRTRLEDKIAKAPTPGLKAKYRESLEQITAAFESLTLAADSSALPVLNKQSAVSAQPSAPGPASPRAASSASGLRSQVSGLPTKPKSSSKEFLIVALIAVAVLGVGGWFVMKTRADHAAAADKARLEALAKTEAEQRVAAEKAEQQRQAEAARLAGEEEKARRATAEKAEQERRDRALALLRSQLAQLKVQAEALFVDEPTKAARRLSELKSDERALAREKETGALARLRAQVDAQQNYVDTLEAILGRHPAKSTQAQATELVGARELEPATEAVALFTSQLAKLDTLVSEARQKVEGALYGILRVENSSAEVQWTFTDGFGEIHRGSGAQTIPRVGIGTGRIDFSRAGWPGLSQSVLIRRGATATAAAEFRPARLTLTGTPAGAAFALSNGQKGTIPAEVEVIPGKVQLSVQLVDHSPHSEQLELGFGEARTVKVALEQEPMWSVAELTDLAQRITNQVAMGIPYTSKLYSLSSSDPGMLVAVSSAMPLNATVPAYPMPDPTLLLARGQAVPVYFGGWNGNTFVNQGTRASNPQFLPVDQDLRPNCGGVVHLAGMIEPRNGRWISTPVVFATSNPALAAAAQQWVNSVRLSLAGPAPAAGVTQYRVLFSIRFRAR
jgi:hypothetical protein